MKNLALIGGIILGILLCLASVVMFLMNIWIPDIHWAQTGCVFLATGVVTVIASAATRDFS